MNRIKRIPLFIIAAILVAIKTYVVYRFYFDLSIESLFQEIILLVNAFAISMFLFFIAVWLKPKSQKRYILTTAIVLSVIIMANLMYYRNFTDFVTVPTLFQVNNAGDLGTSVASLVYFSDILLFLDLALIMTFIKLNTFSIEQFSSQFRKRIVAISMTAVIVNLVLAEIERPMLFQRGFDREYLVKNVGLPVFHAYDLVMTTSTQSKRLFADGSGMDEIDDYVSQNVREIENPIDLTGVAEDKNVIYIAVESMQSFLIDETLHGEEVLPFLNEFKEDSYYFENFYHQTGLGKTSDHEFVLDNSLYPLPNSAAFFTHAQNEYNSLPKIIQEELGYDSYTFHANNGSFWNRNVMYETLGYNEFFDVESYEFEESDEIGWGLNDKKFFDQSIDIMKELDEPYYAKFITLTHHFPFEMPEEEATIDQFDSSSVTLNQYFQTARYTDEALEQFINQLKEEEIYEDSIIVMMGDHYGISSYHNEAMANYLDEDEITPYDEVKLQRVPMIIHIPGHEDTGTLSTLSGQIDYKPTVLNMLGIENENDIVFGNDLFSQERKDFIAFRDGRVVGEDYIYASGNCYEDETGELVEEANCDRIREQAEQELNYSDEIIYGDLFRFYDFEQGEIAEENNE
ncbi:LTA synthase family protein [Alkalibacillus haloalkaliphilus]|uniref:LTA synthase family protein n=1 Tax=Alkalibacillus haloalkaliphilus TaxID=94136 RepID=UPI0029356AAE|nr:LTA synthase family protein [Alkalibacillus haloalkaliphilus]MDV2580986.1 LTA synthase family protein [Alkalibacillus haloalkaliphilus]